LNPVTDHPERITKQLKEQAETLNFINMSFPVKLKDKGIDKFEKQNATISINVLGYDDENKICPLRNSNKDERLHEVNLLLLEDKRYVLISNMSRLLTSQKNKHTEKRHFCLRCLNSFTIEEVLKKHNKYCQKNGVVKITLPEKGTILEINDFNRSNKVPIVVCADFECFTKLIQSCQPDLDKSFTEKYQKHEPSEFCYYVLKNGEPVTQVLYSQREDGEDITGIFINLLEKNLDRIWLMENKPMVMTENNKIDFENAKACCICKKTFASNDKKCRDHDHKTGKYRGATHKKCNLLYQEPQHILVIFHNLSGYDTHLFIKNLGKTPGRLNCIPKTEENYISFSEKIYDREQEKEKFEIRFIDSFRFLQSSLEKLVNKLEKEQFTHLKKIFDEEACELLIRKRVFPCDCFNSLSKFNDTQLSPIEMFYSKLNDSDISPEDFKHAQRVWDCFKMKDFRHHHDLYLMTDVVLLADVFENYVCSKRRLFKNYELDPCWYYPAPRLAWDACLKK